jgi:Skp family chaperone for outer membrane proteins
VHVVAPEWTEGRLDDLNDKVDRGFDKVDQRFEKVDQRFNRIDDKVDRGFEKVDQQFARIDARLDGMQKAMAQAVIAMTAGMLVGFGGIIGLIATQL